MAVLQACETIKERLEKFHQSLSEASEGSPDAALREKLDGLRDAAQERADLRNDDYFKAVVNAVRSLTVHFPPPPPFHALIVQVADA